jgi:hypothetical protein
VTDFLGHLPTQKEKTYPAIEHKRRQPFTLDQAEQICQMIDEGYGIGRTARHASTCDSTIHGIYQKLRGHRPKLRGAAPRTKIRLKNPRSFQQN